MPLKLQADAIATRKVRAYIPASAAPVAERVAALGISRGTVERWRDRSGTQHRSSQPKDINSSLLPLEKEVVRELPARLASSKAAMLRRSDEYPLTKRRR